MSRKHTPWLVLALGVATLLGAGFCCGTAEAGHPLLRTRLIGPRVAGVRIGIVGPWIGGRGWSPIVPIGVPPVATWPGYWPPFVPPTPLPTPLPGVVTPVVGLPVTPAFHLTGTWSSNAGRVVMSQSGTRIRATLYRNLGGISSLSGRVYAGGVIIGRWSRPGARGTFRLQIVNGRQLVGTATDALTGNTMSVHMIRL